MPAPEPLIPKHGGYRKLISFQVAQLVADCTVRFCDRYVDRYSRTHDQMVQAARSGVQNIAEGSQDSATSKKTELKLTGVARGSLEELRLDYEDFLRRANLPIWDREDPRRQELIDRRCKTAEAVASWIKEVYEREQSSGNANRPIGSSSTPSTTSTMSTKSTPSTYPEISANAILALISVASALLSRQIDALAKDFEEHGGFTERLYRVRTERRKNQRQN